MKPEKIADNILKLIDKDVERISDEFKDIRMDAETALTLTRYLKSVYEAKSDQAEDTSKHSDTLSKLSNKELKAMALNVLNKKAATEENNEPSR
jgi:hypothetical protein